MGCCSSKNSSTKNAFGRKNENDLLKQFLLLCNGVENWEDIGQKKDDIATISRYVDINNKEYFTFRGVGIVQGSVGDLYHYFEDNLGGDRFELLEEINDHKSIFYWYHEFSFQRPIGSSTKFNARGGSFTAAPFTSQPSGQLSNGISTLASTPLHEEEVSIHIDESKGESIDSPPGSPKKETSKSSTSKEIVAPILESASSSSIVVSVQPQTNESKSLDKTKKKTFSFRKPSNQKPIGFINNRDFVLSRNVFKLGPTRICLIAESAEHKLKRKVEGDITRGNINIMGVLIEELTEEEKKVLLNFSAMEANADNDSEAFIMLKRKLKDPVSRLTFILSINPYFEPDELARVPEHEISQFFGEARVRDVVDGARAYFELEENKLFVKFRALAAAPIGEMGWVEQEKSKTDLQLGTNVKHPVHGHGIVKKFDMKGRIHVTYDNGMTVEHEATEKDNLQVAVQIGTRVMHPTRGAGTVKQFDEMGRIHVKFDNNEYHRYKQAAWKKKMHEYKLLGTGGALETITLSYRDLEESREKQGRVRFAVGVTTREVLEYLLDYEEDAKTGNIIKNEIIEEISLFHRIRYQVRKMPPPLTDRDFVYDEIWREVAPLTYIIINKSVTHELKKETPGIVRGMIVQSGYLIEPLYTEDGMDHISQISYVLCIDPQGFVPPDAIAGIRSGQLLGAVTDMRAHFWRRTQQKKSLAVVNRKRVSKRVSEGSLKGSGRFTGSTRMKSPTSS